MNPETVLGVAGLVIGLLGLIFLPRGNSARDAAERNRHKR